jgi:hypothetical protein
MQHGEKVRLTDAEMHTTRAEMRAVMIACAQESRTITYSELASRLSLHLHPHSFVFSRLLRDVCGAAEKAGEGLLCALVVSKQTGMPGGGYFASVAARGLASRDLVSHWRADLESVYERWRKL